MLENPKIVTFSERKLIGNKLEMSFAEDKTFQLWSSFMPRHREIKNRIGTYKFSLQNYSGNFQSDSTIPFVKWALMEVLNYNHSASKSNSVECIKRKKDLTELLLGSCKFLQKHFFLSENSTENSTGCIAVDKIFISFPTYKSPNLRCGYLLTCLFAVSAYGSSLTF